jgi:RNA polymerase sigma-70 factor, ECF subfamily
VTPRSFCRRHTGGPRCAGGRLADYEAPEAWVRRVALRLAADRAWRARRRAAALLRLRPPQQPPVELSVDSLDLAACMGKLSVGQRQAIVLHHLVGLTVEEVASQLEIPVGTVKTRLARGRAALARYLETDKVYMHVCMVL